MSSTGEATQEQRILLDGRRSTVAALPHARRVTGGVLLFRPQQCAPAPMREFFLLALTCRTMAHAAGAREHVRNVVLVLVEQFQIRQDLSEPFPNRVKKVGETTSTGTLVALLDLVKNVKNARKRQLAALLFGDVIVRVVDGFLLLLQFVVQRRHEAIELLGREDDTVMDRGLRDNRLELLLLHHGSVGAATGVIGSFRHGRRSSARHQRPSAREEQEREERDNSFHGFGNTSKTATGTVGWIASGRGGMNKRVCELCGGGVLQRLFGVK